MIRSAGFAEVCVRHTILPGPLGVRTPQIVGSATTAVTRPGLTADINETAAVHDIPEEN